MRSCNICSYGKKGKIKESIVFEDNPEILFLFLNENICCDPSLELSG